MERLQNIFISFLFLFFCFSLLLNAQQVAFPGAEGFGRYTTGGRYGSVYHVTNLDDSGIGSFRDAVSDSNRTVVFDVGGVINIGERIVIKKNITIAGQTAPGGGITIYGNGIALNNESGNDIVRYIRIRMGKNGDSEKDAVSISAGQDYIFDHVSISWGRDGTLDVNGSGIDNLTFQDCIIAQGINNTNHSTGGLMQSGKWSMIRSLYIDNKTRNPKARGTHEFINSVLYNWAEFGYIMGDTEGLSECNLIGNYFIYGPSSNNNTHITNTTPSFHVYPEDNWVDSNKDGVLNAYLLTNYKTATVEPSPYVSPGENVLMSAQNALNHVIQYVGASLNSYRDAVDSLLISQLTSYGTAGQIINTEDDNGIPGNVGTVPGGTAPTDTDQDGMPDSWEDENDLNKNNPDDGNDDYNNDGFTNLEEYLNSLIPVEYFVLPQDSLLPAAPSNLKASTFSGNQIDLTWTDNANNERGFIIQYSDDDWSTYEEVTSSWANLRSYSVTGLDGSTMYQFRMAAYNSKGNSEYSNIASDSTIADNHFFLYTSVEGPGSISLDPPGGVYASGTEVEVTAIPDSGYVFDSWTSYLSGVNNPEIITITTTAYVTAKFTLKSIEVPMDYDFGPGTLEPGYTQITVSNATYTVGRGYGFESASGLNERDRGAPDALREDFIVASSPQTFIVDLPNDEYHINMIAGDNMSNAPNGPMDVYAEDILKIQGMYSDGGAFDEQDFTVEITDNQLNLYIVHSEKNDGTWRINVLEITSTSMAVKKTDNVLVSEFRLEQNYPNPFNPNTTISYSIPKSSHVTLEVFDMLGRQVAKLVDEQKKSGYYTVVFHAGDLASGIYFYTLQAGDVILMKKSVLLK
jgi:hypothetical protein